MARPKRTKALPKPVTQDRGLQQFLVAVSEQLDVGQGVRGPSLERFLTLGDLVRSGLASVKRGLGGYIDGGDLEPEFPDIAPDLSTPPKPEGFSASGGFGYIFLTWDNPHEAYSNHAHTNIYRNSEDNFANAELLVIDSGFAYTDPVRQEVIDASDPTKGIGYYYWISFVSVAGVEGPPSDVEYAESIPDLDVVFDILSGQIDESYLQQSLSSRIDLIDGSGPGSVNVRIASETTARTDADEQILKTVDQYQLQNDQEFGAIEESFELHWDKLTGLGAQWTLKMDVNGHVSGVGMYNDGTTSDFAVLADRFWIAHVGVKRKPFIIQNGKVFIDTAWIREGTIQEGQIGAITFGKLTDENTGLPITTVGGKLRADYIDVDNLSVGSAAVFSGDVRSVNYSASTGFRIDAQQGKAWFNDVVIRSTFQSQNYDTSSSGWKLEQNGNFTLRGPGGKIIMSTAGVSKSELGLGALASLDKITGTYIDALTVNTLHIKDNAITIPATGSGGSSATTYIDVDGGSVIGVGHVEARVSPSGEMGASGSLKITLRVAGKASNIYIPFMTDTASVRVGGSVSGVASAVSGSASVQISCSLLTVSGSASLSSASSSVGAIGAKK